MVKITSSLNLVTEECRNTTTYSSVFDRISWCTEYKNEKLGWYEYFGKVQVEQLCKTHQSEQEIVIIL